MQAVDLLADEDVDLLAGGDTGAVDLLAEQPAPTAAPILSVVRSASQADVRKAEQPPIDRPARWH